MVKHGLFNTCCWSNYKPYWEKWNYCIPHNSTYRKINLNCIKYLNVKGKAIYMVEKHARKCVYDPNVVKDSSFKNSQS